jgi:HK97 family phage prohead protease
VIIADHHTATSADPWDAVEAEGRLRRDAGEAELRKAFARADDRVNPNDKAGYSFIHHEVDPEGNVGAASILACRSLIAVLNGTKPGPTLPAAERRSVHQHLATHLRDARLGVPELRAEPYTAVELEGIAVAERRFTPGRVEVRASHGDSRSIGGYAAVFNKLSNNLGGFVEQVEGGAFSRSRTEGFPGVICRFNHDDNMILGSSNSGTLRLHVDDIGLGYEVDPPEARRDIVELVQRGDIQRSSFAFRVTDEVWGLTEQGYPKRSLLSVQLIDVAPVVSPPTWTPRWGCARSPSSSAPPRRRCARPPRSTTCARFLARSDGPRYVAPTKRAFGPAARMALLGRSKDPWADKV